MSILPHHLTDSFFFLQQSTSAPRMLYTSLSLHQLFTPLNAADTTSIPATFLSLQLFPPSSHRPSSTVSLHLCLTFFPQFLCKTNFQTLHLSLSLNIRNPRNLSSMSATSMSNLKNKSELLNKQQ